MGMVFEKMTVRDIIGNEILCPVVSFFPMKCL